MYRLEELLTIADEATVLTDGKVVGYKTKEELDIDDLLFLMSGKDTRDYQANIELKKPNTDKTPLLEVKGLNKADTYQDVSFKVWPGEVLGIYGQVGAGRSEVALSLFGSEPADSGEIYLSGEKVDIKQPWHAIKHGIGYLPEDRKAQGAFSFQSISDNLVSVIFQKLKGPFASMNRNKINNLVAKYQKILSIKYNHHEDPISSLSGGNQQKVIFARWMAENLKLLILDEPTQGIDVMAKRQIHDLIRSLADEGLTVLVISSDLPELLSVSSRLMVMNKGEIVAEYEESQENLEDKLLRSAIGIGGEK